MSEALITCWYHSGKFSSRVGVTAVFLALDMGFIHRKCEHASR
ncbi:hypothetical protein amb3635 [Paramagnetospirillum magneticum AMB-1]|uniref:Uncharacterized protein n=1 Tax=Paramagnetospirillum magneticum (strain ATCC 700264 / AMB-1) TaxID=342108 RepID=Q2W135_PARM1|nr:hypothetical protein amb3635 [Paramagnetospirillum magneticum AMB-1]